MSSTVEVLTALQNSFLGQAIGQSNHLVGATSQVFHILGFVSLLAAVIFINLRLLGLALPNMPLKEVSRQAVKFIWIGFFFASTSGFLMFLSAPTLYYANPAFLAKITLYTLAIVFQVLLYQRVVKLANPGKFLVWTNVLLSFFLWFGVSLTGRAIGYV
ncbi:MAG: hypothetical protein LBI68_00155 [Azoarcus sp.]|jgi:small-conductance mechanosensitive channel|nr:hypothetical protein [Azoarcus sp.]